MQITETNLKFNGTGTKRRSTTRVIIHHSVSGDVSAATIHGWHLNNKWMGIGYHFVIRANGTVERGRAEDLIGAHAGEKGNPDSIGVCLAGDFTKHPPTEAQLFALVDLIQWLRPKYGNLAVIGHKDVMATACPGYMFPWADLHKRLEGEPMAEDWKKEIISKALAQGLIKEWHNPDEPTPKWFVLAVANNLKELIERGMK